MDLRAKSIKQGITGKSRQNVSPVTLTRKGLACHVIRSNGGNGEMLSSVTLHPSCQRGPATWLAYPKLWSVEPQHLNVFWSIRDEDPKFHALANLYVELQVVILLHNFYEHFNARPHQVRLDRNTSTCLARDLFFSLSSPCFSFFSAVLPLHPKRGTTFSISGPDAAWAARTVTVISTTCADAVYTARTGTMWRTSGKIWRKKLSQELSNTTVNSSRHLFFSSSCARLSQWHAQKSSWKKINFARAAAHRCLTRPVVHPSNRTRPSSTQRPSRWNRPWWWRQFDLGQNSTRALKSWPETRSRSSLQQDSARSSWTTFPSKRWIPNHCPSSRSCQLHWRMCSPSDSQSRPISNLWNKKEWRWEGPRFPVQVVAPTELHDERTSGTSTRTKDLATVAWISSWSEQILEGTDLHVVHAIAQVHREILPTLGEWLPQTGETFEATPSLTGEAVHFHIDRFSQGEPL